jgi:hypothetical protein
MDTQQYHPTLPQHFNKLSKDGTDVNIMVGSHPDSKSFLANKIMLDERSSYFTSLILAQDSENNNLPIELPDISPKIFEIILK